MPTRIRFIYDDHLVRDMLGRFATQIPKAGMKDLEEIAKSARREMRRELTLQKINWTHTLWQNIRIQRIGKSGFGIFVPLYGIQLDTMSPHWVSVKRRAHLGLGTSLTIEDWIRSKGRGAFKQKTKGRRKIYVRPHKWIDRSVRRATLKAREKARQARNIKKTIRRKGR